MKPVVVWLPLLIAVQTAMASQSITELGEADLQRLQEQRQVVLRYLGDEGLEKLGTPAGKLGALRALIEARVFAPEQTYELQSMGIVFGDVFVQDLGFTWVMVEDEYGKDPALKYPATTVFLFPLTMISKRIEAGEDVDVFELYNRVADLAVNRIDEELQQ